MRSINLPLLALLCLSSTQALAVDWGDVLSSGATTASTYLTVKDKKMIVPLRDDASSFVASDGQIRGPYLQALLLQLRESDPQLQASDMELARAVLASEL
ncbi:DUF2388 domain-containing protein [Pseudomonas sp. EA_105y_Pfl2_R69]|uniref:DUF2388 domain-containing protein n=1 Tax=Pseudomonas sp. EA_105y_Pfl2_R69 TaxID=3088683 RepID=UPI0030DD30DB